MKYRTDQLKIIPTLPGIYQFYAADNSLLYVGKAKNLKNRVSSYFQKNLTYAKTRIMAEQISCLDVIPVASEFEALLLEAELIRKYQPKYNILLRDDKHYIYIKITKETFPKIIFARKKDVSGEYFGPFPSAVIVRQILSYLRSVFPYCTQNPKTGRACFYHHLGLCNPCPSQIIKLKDGEYKAQLKLYRTNIRNIRDVLNGKIKKVRALITAEMHLLAQRQEFEQAAGYRDKLNGLDYLITDFTPVSSYIGNPKLLADLRRQEEQSLISALHPYFPDLNRAGHLECYDISNISGKLAVGSMVTFINGTPDKNLYRRFRIKLAEGPNDFAMLSEVISRRIKHTEWRLPDIFILDGGKPQLMIVGKALQDLKLTIPVIGLAKEREEIVVPHDGAFAKIRLANGDAALNLIKRLRDEAHRFAHKYHTLLRLKYMLQRQ